jgi:hypothetical protein
MPRLPKFKDYHISPLTGPMNSLTPLDLLNDKQFRYIKNFRVDGAGRLKRAGGFKALFDDGNYNVSGTIKNNSDLHDQLGSKQTPTNTTREPITLLYEFESGSGSRKLIAATKSRIYALNQRSRNWVLIGDNGGGGYGQGTSASFSTTKFKAAQLGNNIVFTNNYDQPLNWYFDANPKRSDKNLVQAIPDLVKLKITKAAHISEYKGFMFLADLEEATTQQVAKVQWSDYVDATSYYPSLASLAGQQTVGDIGERIIGMAVLGDHLMIYKERSIWRCSLVSSSNLFVFKQVYQGENTPFYEDTLVNTGDAHFFMSQAGIYRMTLASLRPQRVDWMHNASAIIFEDDKITGEDGTGPRHVTGGIKNLTETQSGDIATLATCPSRPPVISAHPGNLTINANPCSASYTGSATLSVTTSAGVEPFTYQWQKKLESGSTWANITNANKSSFTISNPKSSDLAVNGVKYQYRVNISNDDGNVNSNSSSVTFAADSGAPSFSKHPDTYYYKTTGDDVELEVRFCGTIKTIQWVRNADGTPVNINHDGTKYIVESGQVEGGSGYNFSKLTIKNLAKSDETGGPYACKATNMADQNTTSNNAEVYVTRASTVTVDSDTGGETVTASADALRVTLLSQPRYELYINEWIGRKFFGGVIKWRGGNFCEIKRLVSGVMKEQPNYEQIMAKVAGGKKKYIYRWQISPNTSGISINNTGGYTASSNAQTINVDTSTSDRLRSAYKKNTVITFTSGATFTLTKDAKFTKSHGFPNQLTGILAGGNVADNEASTNTYNWKYLSASTDLDSSYKGRVTGENFNSISNNDGGVNSDTVELSVYWAQFDYVDSYIRLEVKDSADSVATAYSAVTTIDCRPNATEKSFSSNYDSDNAQYFSSN